MNPLLIHDREDFRHVSTRLHAVFDFDRRLPEQVLRNQPEDVAFFEFEDIFYEHFWSALRVLGEHWGEPAILFSSVDPDPEQHFRREVGYFGAARLPLELAPADYVELLVSEPEGHPIKSFVTRCDVLAYVSGGGGFAVWADRALELGLLAMYDTGRGLPPRLPQQVNWFDAQRACVMSEPAFGGKPVPAPVRECLIGNYPRRRP